jgi:Ulp1 family protease
MNGLGLMPLYSTDMGDQLRGWDITCTDYIGTPWYVYIGWIMIIINRPCLRYYSITLYDSLQGGTKSNIGG